ncbi:MAG: hypothetical protein ACRC5H_03800 [Treponemataceae bacterium]
MPQKFERHFEVGEPISFKTGCWIKYQLNLFRISQADIAKKANCHGVIVSQFLGGVKNSNRTRAAIASLLGYKSFDDLLAAARREAV